MSEEGWNASTTLALHDSDAPQIAIPWGAGGPGIGRRAAQREAKAELDGALATRIQLRQQIREEVTDAYYQLSELVDRIRTADQQRKSTGQALRLAQARYAMQLASFLDVLTAQNAKTAAETSSLLWRLTMA